MAIALKSLYEQTRNLYHLKLICGENGIDNIMSWVYISEDISTSVFLQGGELVITTGITSTNSDTWLYDFIHSLILNNTCGLILNTGRYLFEEDITPEIRKLCSLHQFPLFTMPWETRIFDITHDYYNRIFLESQTEEAIKHSFLELLHGHDISRHFSALAEYGFPEKNTYHIAYIRLSMENPTDSRLLFSLERLLKRQYSLYHLGKMSHYLFLIVPSPEQTLPSLTEISNQISTQFPNAEFHCGYGGKFTSLSELTQYFFYAKAAASMSFYYKKPFLSFHDMGFIKILFSVNDSSILENYVTEKLGRLKVYDLEHNSDYLNTLHQYLTFEGSIQKIAAALFCHRNTVNYRIHVLKEELHYNLEDTQEKFELMAAFQILEYLPLLKESDN